MELDHVDAAGLLMKPIDVLRQELLHASCGFKSRQGAMSRVWFRAGHDRPSGHATRPVTLACRFIVQKIPQEHRRGTLPVTVGAPVSRNAGIGADPCTGEDKQSPVPSDEFAKVRHRMSRTGKQRWLSSRPLLPLVRQINPHIPAPAG